MADYKQMYFTLFHAVTDAIELLQTKGDVVQAGLLLMQAQCQCEDIYIETAQQDTP